MEKYFKQTIGKAVNESVPKRLIDLTPAQVEKLRTVASVILAVAAVATVASVAVVAPNALKLINTAKWVHKTFRKSSLSKRSAQKKALIKSFYYLKSHGYISLNKNKKGMGILISDKGRQKLASMQFKVLQTKKDKAWDGCWWFVLADIPTEDYKYQADQFRKKVKELNFFPLQRTVWVYPFDPRDEIGYISSHYGIDRFVTTLKASEVDSDDLRKLKSHFIASKII
jgi:hypothetical protein